MPIGVHIGLSLSVRGSKPRMVVKVVMMIGKNLVSAAFIAAALIDIPSSTCSLAKSTNTYQTDKTNKSCKRKVKAGQPQSNDRPNEGQWQG